MAVAVPGESAEYRVARDRLLDQEVELRRAMEAVAEARRRLPPGGVVPQDYVFQAQGPDGAPAQVRLSELFAPGKNSLLIYSMMFPRAADDNSPGPPGGHTALLPLAEGPCPSCTALLDQLDGAAGHVSQHVNLVVAAKAPLERVLTFAAERGWRRLRLLSSAESTYNRDYLAETADGAQQPMLNVFHRDGETIRHFWGSELFYAPARQAASLPRRPCAAWIRTRSSSSRPASAGTRQPAIPPSLPPRKRSPACTPDPRATSTPPAAGTAILGRASCAVAGNASPCASWPALPWCRSWHRIRRWRLPAPVPARPAEEQGSRKRRGLRRLLGRRGQRSGACCGSAHRFEGRQYDLGDRIGLGDHDDV
jgi:predicted dithiol-disulfide oxidoreductase (DUF899 family)